MFNNCTAKLKQVKLPEIKSEKPLKQMCLEGATKIGVDLTPEYMERLDYELSIIESKGFTWYFLIVADLMQWANKNQLVGPGRGSSAGSLVAYLLEITTVDPIRYGLLFFRFLDPSRTDTPDIDMDFADRDAAVDYVIEKYGKKYAAKLGTFANWQDKNTINEIAKALDIPRFEFNPILDAIPKYAANDSRADTALKEVLETTVVGRNFLVKYPECASLSRLINKPSHSATHAAGVVIAGEELTNYVSIDSQTKTIQSDLHMAEKIGLLKLDLLGLSTLKIIQDTLDLAGRPREYLSKIEIEDRQCFDILNKNKYLGVFQFEGYALKALTQTVEVTEFNDLPILSSLSRPGASVGADTWVRRKKGLESVTYAHPLFEPYLKETLGLIVYQEQIMLIANELADMPWSQVTKLRKAIGKSLGAAAMAEYELPFMEGLKRKGIPEDIAARVWSQILDAGSYGFNKSHAVAYSFISYWTMHLKAYFPYEFAAATLTSAKDSEKQLAILHELYDEGIEYVAVDPELSTDKWRVVGGKLIGPLQNIIGLGPSNVKEILSARSRNEPLKEAVQKKLNKAKTKLDCLFPLRDYLSNVDMSRHIAGDLTMLAEAKPNGNWQENVYVCGIIELITERDENEERRVADRIARGQQGIKSGFTKFIEIRLKDDTTNNFYLKVGPKEYEGFCYLTSQAVKDKTVLVAKGTITPEAPVMLLRNAKIIGEL